MGVFVLFWFLLICIFTLFYQGTSVAINISARGINDAGKKISSGFNRVWLKIYVWNVVIVLSSC